MFQHTVGITVDIGIRGRRFYIINIICRGRADDIRTHIKSEYIVFAAAFNIYGRAIYCKGFSTGTTCYGRVIAILDVMVIYQFNITLINSILFFRFLCTYTMAA
ncbi:hypothetical protein D9M68_717860 [compost metagenome]